MEPLPITLAHVLASGSLPSYHRDRFDRMLIAQGQVEQLVIVTHDAQLRSYAVETVW
ncbi:MAG TPA: type II toxin-antitoxin system VapC family toxin [Bryobacteraceae bacterium]|nr:type II toxin-antitoxin system VapC family toxin [Bryobacteraceae bacterium]